MVAVMLAAAALTAPTVTAAGTVSGDANFTLSPISLPSGGTVARWNPCQARITYKVNAAQATDPAGAIRDTREAFRRLGVATGITFTYTGTTSMVPNGSRWAARQDAEVVVAWTRPSGSTLLGKDAHGTPVAATGGYWWQSWAYPGQPWKAAITRGYVVVNNDQASAFRAGFGSGVTRGNLLLHELGHVVGLQHTTAESQLMYPVILSRSSTGYRAGDMRGLRTVGRAAGCILTPTSLLADL